MPFLNLATATQANRKLVALLTKTIAELTTQATFLTVKLLTAQAEKNRLNISGYSLSNIGTPADRNPPLDWKIYSKSGNNFDPNRYCSLNGFMVEEDHTSATCLIPLGTHKKLATQLDNKGGRQWTKDWVNGGPTKWGGAILDSYVVDINKNNITYINYNPKLVEVTNVDELEITDMGTTGQYLTLDYPCDNKKTAVIPPPIRMPNVEIITSTHTALGSGPPNLSRFLAV